MKERGQHQLLRLQRYFPAKSDHISNLMLACEKGTLPMVDSLVNFEGINILHTDSRKLHAGFYAV